MSKVRGVRFSEPEEALIEKFLSKNSLMDFSTLAKIAILDFIKNPKMRLIAVRPPTLKTTKENVRPIS
jgi:hypothetical protein